MIKPLNAVLTLMGLVDRLADTLSNATVKDVRETLLTVTSYWAGVGLLVWILWNPYSAWGVVFTLGPAVIVHGLFEGAPRLWRHLQGEDDE